MGNKYPKVQLDWERLTRSPYFTHREIFEILFGVELEYLQYPPISSDKYQILASNTCDKLSQWISREIKTGRLTKLPFYEKRDPCIPATEIKKWLVEHNIIQWLLDIGIQVPPETLKFFNFNSTGENKKDESSQIISVSVAPLQPKNKSSNFLPAPPGTEWKDIGIGITQAGQVFIKIKGERRSYSQNQFKEVIPQETISTLLFKILHAGGQFDKTVSALDKTGHFKNYVHRLRMALKKTFGIEADPIPWAGSEYKTQFSATSELKDR